MIKLIACILMGLFLCGNAIYQLYLNQTYSIRLCWPREIFKFLSGFIIIIGGWFYLYNSESFIVIQMFSIALICLFATVLLNAAYQHKTKFW